MSRRTGILLAAALLASVLAAGLWRGRHRRPEDRAGDVITLRFAHWQLEGGIREAFDTLARDYEARHPNIRVEQIAIPVSSYVIWGITHIVGGDPPDLMELGKNLNDPRFFRYFTPITEAIELPNPYNAGTRLEGVPWRKTFVDGMESTFNLQSFDCYGASILASTTRIYYNEALMREITGRNRPPRSLEEMVALCARVRDFASRTGRPIMPFAGSWANGPDMMDDYFRTQTQRLGSRLNPGTFDPVTRGDFLLAYLNHEWTLDSPEILRAFDMMSVVGDALPAGFDLSDRDIAFSCFDQGRALMLSAYSQDATGVLRYANFPVGVFRDPTPAPATAGFGANMVARNSEHALIPYGAFTITRASPHPAEALDFLRFITSQREDRKFSALADTLPVVVGVNAAGFMRNFIPDGGGFPPGPSRTETGDVRMLVVQNWYRLFGPSADRPAFLAALSRDLSGAARRDMRRAVDGAFQSVASNDAYVEAARRLARDDSPRGTLDLKYQTIVETQNDQEAVAYYQALRLRQSDRFQ